MSKKDTTWSRRPHHGRERALELVRGGMSRAEAAKAVGASVSIVYFWCRNAGIPTTLREVTPEEKADALAKIQAGMLRTEVSRLFGVSDGTVSTWCKKAGLPPAQGYTYTSKPTKKTPTSQPKVAPTPLETVTIVYNVGGTFYSDETAARKAAKDKQGKLVPEEVRVITLPGKGPFVLGAPIKASYTTRAELRASLLAGFTEEEKAALGF